MKRIKWFALFAAAAMLSMGTISCGGDDSSPSGGSTSGGSGGSGSGGSGNTVLTKAEQTAHLETSARELISMAPASDFQEVTSLTQDVRQQNWNNPRNWASNIFDQTLVTVSENLDNSYKSDTYESYYYTRNFQRAFIVSNYKGHFEIKSGEWKLVDSNVNDLQFTFTDSKNATWNLKAETTGAVKRVHMLALKDRNYNSQYDGTKGVYKQYTDITQYIIGVPEKFIVTLTKNGTQMAKVTFNAKLSDITGEEFDLSKDNLTADATIEVKNYKINISQIAYTANKTAAVNTTVTNDDKQLLSLSVASDFSGLNQPVNVSSFTSNFDSKTLEYAEGNAVVKVDILGKVQLQGTVSKVHALIDKVNDAKKVNREETAYKTKIKEANEFVDLGMFFNNGSAKQAKVYLEPFPHKGYRWYWDNTSQRSVTEEYTYWGWDMVIKFGDESSYSLLSEYFSKSNFRTVYGDLEQMINNYRNLIK
jgi:hypothetical protein